MPKKGAKKVSDEVQTSTNQAKPQSESSKKASKSESSSGNALFWIIFFLLSGGLCFGIKTFLDEEFSKIALRLAKYDDEIKTAVESQANTKELIAAIHSVSEMKQVLNDLQQKQALAAKEIQILRNSFQTVENQQTNWVKELDLLVQDIKANSNTVKKLENQVGKELVESFTYLNSSLYLAKSSMTSMEKEMQVVQQQFRNFDKPISTNVKDIVELRKSLSLVNYEVEQAKISLSKLDETVKASSEDTRQLSATTNRNNEKVSSIEATVSTLAASHSKLESSSKHNEDSIKSRLAENEKKQATFEHGLSDKIALLEQTTSRKLADMLKEVVVAKQLAETVEKDSYELKGSLKDEFTAAVTRLVEEYQQMESKISNERERIKKIEDQILKLETSEAMLKIDGDSKVQLDDVNTQMQRISAEVADVTRGLNRVEDNLKQSDLKTEISLTSLTENMKKSKDELSNIRDEINDLYGSLEDVETKIAEAAPSQKVKPKEEAPGKN